MPEEPAPTNPNSAETPVENNPTSKTPTESSQPITSGANTIPAAKKTSPTMLVVGLVVLVFLALVGGAYIFFKNSPTSSTPTATSQTTSKTANGTDNSSLDSLAQSVSNDLTKLTTDEGNIDKGLNDQAPDLSY